MPNTKARLKPPIDFLVRTEPLYNAWLPLVSSSLSNVISQIGVFVLVRVESLWFSEKKRETREKIDDERCFISIYTNINVQSFRRRRQRRSHRRSSGRDGAFRAVRFIREYRNLESL